MNHRGLLPRLKKVVNMEQAGRPLDGIRVLEVGQLLAGPFVGTMLGYYGAEVIVKMEHHTGGAAWAATRNASRLICAARRAVILCVG